MDVISLNNYFCSNLITNLLQPPPARVLIRSRGKGKGFFSEFQDALWKSDIQSGISVKFNLFVLATKTEKAAPK